MTLKTVFENDYGTVRYEDEHGYVFHTFNRPIGVLPFQEVLNAGLDALAANEATKWMSDDRKNAEFAPEDIQFAVGDWGPRAAAAGWKYWALVVPEDIAGRASMTDIINTFYELGVQVAIFVNLEDAQKWILER